MTAAEKLVAWFRGPHRHRPVTGWMGGTPYGGLAYRGTDGMGITHVAVVVRCRDCGKPFDAALFHTTDGTLATHREAVPAINRVLQSNK